MFLIQRSFLLAVFIPHEDFTPQKYVVHSSMRKNCLVNVYCNFIVNLDRSL
jgi:hypothetical protein